MFVAILLAPRGLTVRITYIHTYFLQPKLRIQGRGRGVFWAGAVIVNDRQHKGPGVTPFPHAARSLGLV